MNEKELVKNIVEILDKKKGLNIKIIDLAGLSTLGDYFVVCSGRSTTQVKALVDYLDEEMEKLKTEFPNDYQQRIERVSEYCASTGKSYKNYLATIRNWAKKDAPKTEPKRKSYEEQAKEWMNY